MRDVFLGAFKSETKRNVPLPELRDVTQPNGSSILSVGGSVPIIMGRHSVKKDCHYWREIYRGVCTLAILY